MKNTICTISIYYGKFNNYFRLWLRTCELNPSIDFLIVTDIDYKEPVPENVIFIRMSMAEIRERATKAVGFEVDIPTPYKLCDFRPLYGIILKDKLTQYRYWGHNDMDMFYGDIMKYLDIYDYQRYDKFLPLGHLSFYKNTDEIGTYFKLPGSKVGDYRTILTTGAKIFAFDEVKGIDAIMLANKKPIFFKRIFADITPQYYRMRISENAGIDYRYDKNYKYQIFYWENGHVYRDYVEDGKMKTQEFIYIHLFRRPNYTLSFNPDTITSFYITPKGFVPKDSPTTLDTIKRLNPYQSSMRERLEWLNWAVLKVVEKIKKSL